jgi:CubicO group peptidase (beta-lactamase class C family)
VLFGADIKFGLGYELEKGVSGIGNLSPVFKNKMFGHAGVGGAVAFGDPEKKLGYGFVCNQQHQTRGLYQTHNQLVEKLYSIF